MAIPRGERIGPYQVVESIGSGGMGEVYRATDVHLKRDVAIKVLPESFASDSQRVARFAREAEVLASLNHSNIAHLYGLERSGATTALIMELVDGPTLAERISRGPLAPDEAIEIALQIAAALEAAHEHGVVHRDLKPANVKLRPDGSVKVLDFGVAKALDSHASAAASKSLTTPAMTEAGLVLGTAAYMAPEQARGRAVDSRADIWSFGCVLYEMLTGRHAFLSDDVTSTLARVLEREPDLAALPKTVTPNVRSAIELCLRKDPRKRIADIRDVRLALEGQLATSVAAVASSRGDALWRRAVPVVALLGTFALAGLYLLRAPARVEPSAQAAPAPVTRFTVLPPAGTRLSNQGGYDVVISPDGSRVAFFAEDENTPGRMSLYVRDLDSLETRRLAGTELPASLGIGNPTFSPDGRSIAFYSQATGLARVSVDGGPIQKIADVPSGAYLGGSWAPDGTLVFSNASRLFRVAATGGAPEPLTPDLGPNPAQALVAPVLLPDGSGVLYGVVEGASQTEAVAVLDLATGEQKVLVEGAQNPSYLPSGHLVFARGTTLMAAAFELGELALTGSPVVQPENVRDPGTNTAADYAVAGTGTLVYVPDSQQRARDTLVWVDGTGRAVAPAVAETLSAPRDPRVSPDGTRIAVTTGREGESQLWVHDLRGRPPIPLALVDDNRTAVWSADSTRVALSGLRGVFLDVFVTPADGSAPAPAPLRPDRLGGWVMDWHANELLVVGFPQNNIMAVDVTTGVTREIVVSPDAEMDPALSPDGRWLAYSSNRTGRFEIWVKGYPDGVPVRLSSNGGYEPHWSASGSELFYLQGNTLMTVTVDEGTEFSFHAPTELFTATYATFPEPSVNSYDVAPDGRFLMIQRQSAADAASDSGFVVVQNWMEELERRVPASR